jgi:hypothetical protein
MSWLRREMTEPGQSCVISDQHKAIKSFFSIHNMVGQKKKWGYCALILYATYFGELVQSMSQSGH